MDTTKRINVDIDKNNLSPPVFSKELDKGTRFINVKLISNGQQIVPDSDCIAIFRGIKPDGHSFMNTATIENDGTITAELTEQILAVSGNIKCDISLLKGGLISEGVETLSSSTFILEAQKVPFNDNSTPSAPEMTYLMLEIHASEAWAHGRSDFPERATDNSMYYTHVSEAWAKGRSDFPERETDNAKYYNKVSEAWAHGRSDFPERASDNAKYWSEQAQAAVGLALVDDVTGLSYKLGVHDGNLYIEQILTS